MNEALYENHNCLNRKMPIVFHKDKLSGEYLSIYSHWHDSLELLFVMDGEALIYLDSEQVEVGSGDILAINSEVIHNINAKNGYAYYYCLIISKELCEQFGFDLESTRLNSVIRDEKIFNLIEEISNEQDFRKPYYSARIMAYVLTLLAQLFSGYSNGADYMYKNRKAVIMVKRAIDYMHQNYMKKINVSEIAEYAGYSKYHFCREFKQFTGDTVIEHISRIKIDYAYKFLSGGESITDTAEKCGFDDVSYFTKLFKKYKGVLPSSIAKNTQV